MSDSGSQPPKTLFQIVKNWLRSGSIEVASASKIGRVRLSLSDLRQDRDQALQNLGGKTYELMQKGALKAAELNELFDQVKSVEKMIIIKEAEVQQYIKEKEQKLLGAPDAAVSSYKAPSPERLKAETKPTPKPAPKPAPKPKPKPEVKPAPAKKTPPKAKVVKPGVPAASSKKGPKPKTKVAGGKVKKTVKASTDIKKAKTVSGRKPKKDASAKTVKTGRSGGKPKKTVKKQP
ncbi:MAG: hypothetical protein ACE5GM_04410 [bacterium]